MDLNLVQNELDFVDEAYKRALQKKVASKLRSKPPINSVDELLDWKMELWEFQFKNDKRIDQLFNNYLSEDEVDNFLDTVICNPYIPNVPFLQQTLLLLSRNDILYGGARGGGKALAIDTPVVTPDGLVPIGDIEVGDTVVDCDGEPCTVIEKSPVFHNHPCYRITFDDEFSVIADGIS